MHRARFDLWQIDDCLLQRVAVTCVEVVVQASRDCPEVGLSFERCVVFDVSCEVVVQTFDAKAQIAAELALPSGTDDKANRGIFIEKVSSFIGVAKKSNAACSVDEVLAHRDASATADAANE